jgi:hypothetical protein
MRRLVVANDRFSVYAPSFISWDVVISLLQLRPSRGMNWLVKHEPTGTEFRLSADEHRILDALADRLGKLLGRSGRDPSEVLLGQIELFWRERQRKQQVDY